MAALSGRRGRATPADRGLRGFALGRRATARIRRPPRGVVGRRAAARPLHRAARAVRASTWLGWREAELEHDLAVAARSREHRATALGAAEARRASGRDADTLDRAGRR